MKKKIVLLAMLALTGVGLAACSNHSTSNSDNKKTEQTESKSDEDAKYEVKQKKILAKTKKSAEGLADAINDNKSNIIIYYSERMDDLGTEKKDGYTGYSDKYTPQPAISLKSFEKKYNLNYAQRSALSGLFALRGIAIPNFSGMGLEQLYGTLKNAKVIKGEDGKDTIYSVKATYTIYTKDRMSVWNRSVENTEEIDSTLVDEK